MKPKFENSNLINLMIVKIIAHLALLMVVVRTQVTQKSVPKECRSNEYYNINNL